MTALAFDTLKFAKRLKEAGFTEQQAEALAAAEAEFIEDNLTTKHDLKEVEAALTRHVKEVEAALTRDIKELDIKIELARAELKRDIKELEAGLRAAVMQLDVKIEQLRTELKRDLKDLEHGMTIKLGTLLAVAVGVVAALVKLL